MKIKDYKKQMIQKKSKYRWVSCLLVFCMILSYLNVCFIPSYAADETPQTIQVGNNVNAVLKDGVLTLSGNGAAYDYSPETAPFLSYAGKIRTLVITDGITYIGAYLFYGLGGLGGKLELPQSITGFGDGAFSGADYESAPRFTVIKNGFTSGEVPIEQTAESGQGEGAPASETDVIPNEEEAQQESPQTMAQTPENEVETITRQKIEHPETLFFPGQTGFAVCSGDNITFIQSVQSAGYQKADASVKVLLDNQVEQELPAVNGQIYLPECPEEIRNSHGEDDSFTYEFAGWTRTPESENILTPGEAVNTEGADELVLYSVWNSVPKYQLRTARIETVQEPDSETAIYVAQTSGNDATGDGTKEKPLQTFDKAAEVLKEKNPDGTVLTNKIILWENYKLEKDGGSNIVFTKNKAVPASISGVNDEIKLTGDALTGTEYSLQVYKDLCISNITAEGITHIYNNGKNITIGEGVKQPTSMTGFYLYGGGQSSIDDGVGQITVRSGRVERIVGYVRSNTLVDASGKQPQITVAGTANVSTIIAGNASGGVTDGDVIINIEGGKVGKIAGGNQGFEANSSPYSGKTAITVTGGEVTDIYGAGTGRNRSIPTYLGDLSIKVLGGKVGNIYGAGSAAYVHSINGKTSTADISVAGGEVGNIYTAGIGGDKSVAKDKGFADGVKDADIGSFTGNAKITVSSGTVGNIYAGGAGYKETPQGGYDITSNAYFKGNAAVTVTGNARITGNVYGGGQGREEEGYEECARIDTDSTVKIVMDGGAVEGSVFGGGQYGTVKGDTDVSVKNGTVGQSVYGGGENGKVEGKTNVTITGGIIANSVYGGALGETGKRLVFGGATVNMMKGQINGNLYGGSQFSNDGPDGETAVDDLIFVNLIGGTVKGNVFGGSLRGKVAGSTHLHIGEGAPEDCNYYKGHTDILNSLKEVFRQHDGLVVEGSVYAGGDYGGQDAVDYDQITITGTSHVYIDGTGYDTGGSLPADSKGEMSITGGVFGSGASCDAGSTRLVTLENYGVRGDGGKTGTRTLSAIQRADRVLLKNAHVRLTGQSDIANANQTALYSMNSIGTHDRTDNSLEPLGAGVVLQGGSTVILDSAAIEIANFKSVDNNGKEISAEEARSAEEQDRNVICFNSGTVLRVAYTAKNGGKTIYGAVAGYAYMMAADTADANAYARWKEGEEAGKTNNADGGFINTDGEELTYQNVESTYRYWQIKGQNASADRHTVLTVQKKESGESGYNQDGYSVAKGSIELPQTKKDNLYTIKSITIPTEGMTLADAAKDSESTEKWATSGVQGDEEAGKTVIRANPESAFGLFMKPGEGFVESENKGKVVSNATAQSSGPNSIINSNTVKTSTDGIPYIDFYLTYYNEGINVSRSVGTVIIELVAADGTTTIMSIEIVTRAQGLADQSVDLYATQSGSYTGELIIPKGEARGLTLTDVSNDTGNLIADGQPLNGGQYSISMKPVKEKGWSLEKLMTEAYDLGKYADKPKAFVGTTDSRFDAYINFTLKNRQDFTEKDTESVKLTFQETGGETTIITLNIHWKMSAVSGVSVMRGRQYNSSIQEENIFISPQSAVTTKYTLGSTVNVPNLWLELQDESGNGRALPAGTQITLLSEGRFYSYKASGSETDNKVVLSAFTEMWGNTKLSGNLVSGSELTVILDFSTCTENPSAGIYSLCLREESSADIKWKTFNIISSGTPAVTLDNNGSGLVSKGNNTFKLNISHTSDTRLEQGAAVVLSSKDGGAFPKGIVFRCGGPEAEKTYYPSGGKVYIPLSNLTEDIIMDTSDSVGLKGEEFSIKAEILPAGFNAGAEGKTVAASTGTFSVNADPEYALSIKYNESRIVPSRTASQLKFEADYAVSGTPEGNLSIETAAKRKRDGVYSNVPEITGTSVAVKDSGGTKQISVSVPKDMEPGTYRLMFTFGDKTVPYNIIIE